MTNCSSLKHILIYKEQICSTADVTDLQNFMIKEHKSKDAGDAPVVPLLCQTAVYIKKKKRKIYIFTQVKFYIYKLNSLFNKIAFDTSLNLTALRGRKAHI